MNQNQKKINWNARPKEKFRLFTVLPKPKEITPRDYASIPYRWEHFPAQITPPASPRGYADTNRGIGGVFYRTGREAFEKAVIDNSEISYECGRTAKAEAQAHTYSHIFYSTQSEIHHALEAYLVEHNGVVDGWPDPAPGWSFTSEAARLNSRYDNSEDGEVYSFHFFGGDFEATEFGYLIPQAPSETSWRATWYDYEPIAAAQRDKESAQRLCKEYSVFKFFIEAAKLWLRCIVPILCIVTVLFTLAMGLCGLTTDVLRPLTEALAQMERVAQLPVPLMLICGFLLLLLFGVPAAAVFFINFAELLFQLFLSMTSIPIIAALLTSVIAVIGALIGEYYVAKVIPTPKFFDPRIASRARSAIREIDRQMNTPVYRKIDEENTADKQAKQTFIDSFYSQWFAFYRKTK